MTKIDYGLGVLLLAVIAPVVIFPGAHWSVIAMLSLAALIFVVFVVPTPKERCKRCGHYFRRNIVDRYIQRNKVNKCSDCLTARRSDPSSTTGVAV